MTDKEITHAINGAAIEVHRLLGPGLLESAYEECFARKLALTGLHSERQKPVPIVYKDVKLECGYRMDFVVEGKVVVELKAVESLAPIHDAIMITYLRLSSVRLGLLINFNVHALKDGVRRLIV